MRISVLRSAVVTLVLASSAAHALAMREPIYDEGPDPILGPYPDTVEEAAAECPKCTVSYAADGTPVLSSEEPADPAAVVDQAPPALGTYVEIVPAEGQVDLSGAGPAPTPFQLTKEWREERGNPQFKAGYVVGAYLIGTPASASAGSKLEAKAEARAYAAAFGLAADLALARASAFAQQGGNMGAAAEVYIVGRQVYYRGAQTGFVENLGWSRQFFTVSTTFTVGPVPLTLSGGANGMVGLVNSIQARPDGVKVSSTPTANAALNVSALVDLVAVQAGVTGYLTLLNLGLPVSGELFGLSCTQAGWKLGMDATVNTLSGNLKAFARVNLPFWQRSYERPITSWTGYTRSFPIFHAAGQIPASVSCPSGAPAGSSVEYASM